jgi:hypothetical protein
VPANEEERNRSDDIQRYERREDREVSEAASQQKNEQQGHVPDEAHRPEQEIQFAQIHLKSPVQAKR